MAVLTGRLSDVYIATGAGSAFTDQACTLVSGTTYQINDTAKRIWDPSTALIAKDGGVAINPAAYQPLYGTGKVTLRVAPAGAVTVTGASLSVSQLSQSFEWSLNFGPNLADSAVFGDSWESKIATLRKGSCSLKRFYLDDYFLDNIDNYFLLALYEVQTVGSRYMVTGKLDQAGVSVALTGLMEQDASFQTFGGVDYSAT